MVDVVVVEDDDGDWELVLVDGFEFYVVEVKCVVVFDCYDRLFGFDGGCDGVVYVDVYYVLGFVVELVLW